MALKEIPNLIRPVEDDPCFPIYGELIRMLEQDMTVNEAIIEHCKNFQFGGVITANDHDLWHIVLGMAELKMGKPLTNLNFGYNNNGASEYIVNLMQRAFDDYEEKPSQIQAYKHSYRSKIKHALEDGGEIDRKIGAFKNNTSVYKLGALFPLLAHGQNQHPPKSYFEYLLDTELQKDVSSPQTHTSETTNSIDQSILDVMDKSDLKLLFEIMIPVIELCLDNLEKQNRRRFLKKPKAFCENRNEAIRNLRIRDLWNLMPTTRHEPDFEFTDKWANQPFFEVG